jgi:hypothetical protein
MKREMSQCCGIKQYTQTEKLQQIRRSDIIKKKKKETIIIIIVIIIIIIITIL